MIKFLVVDHVANAVPYAQERSWTQLGYARYATPERDDIRVVERIGELFSVSGVWPLIKGPGYEELLASTDERHWPTVAREHARKFEELVKDGTARWVE